MFKRLLILYGICCCCLGILRAQIDSYYEFKCDSFDDYFTCPIRWYGDTMLVVTHLFDEIGLFDESFFTFQDSCVYLTIDGQKGLFWGNSNIGSWNIMEKEYERFTVKWDGLLCAIGNDTIFKFEFIPYYQEMNPYIDTDETKHFSYYYDMTSYYWTFSAGIIAIEGERLYVRKGFESFKDCLKNVK